MMPMRAAALLLLTLLLPLPAHPLPLDRDRDPVVMAGLDLPSFQGLPVDRIAAFRYQGGWIQIPVQVDQRHVVDFGVVYGGGPLGIATLAYSDSGTYTGPDPDPSFDGNDELVVMAGDAGDRIAHARNLPAGLVTGSGLELALSDPIDGAAGYVYLFETDGTLDPDAGTSYGAYTFDLLAGSYLPHYDTTGGPNLENSAFVSPLYRTHFSDRWIRDELELTAAGASGVDILDRHKNLFGPGVCNRTEETFSSGEGAFFANISGPVRSIRSYLGANSGPLTQRDHFFYAGRQDIVTSLRVHAIPGVMDLYDYSPAATGMSYHNDLNPSGVIVDGVPDTLAPGAIRWELVTGGQGSLIVAHAVETDIPAFAYTSYYSDDVTPGVTQCTGDAFEYATSGLWIDQAIPNTHPGGTYNILRATRVVYYEAPGQTVADAELRFEQATTLLTLVTAPLPEAPDCDDGLDNDGDGLTDFSDDPGCDDVTDLSERSPLLACDDGADNDGDGGVDFDPVTYADPGDQTTPPSGGGDPGCISPSWATESPRCQDGVDNDGDGQIDYDAGLSANGSADSAGPDPQCLGSPWVIREAPVSGCGVGAELALLLPALLRTHRRRGRLTPPLPSSCQPAEARRRAAVGGAGGPRGRCPRIV
jgi:hypothetical protein